MNFSIRRHCGLKVISGSVVSPRDLAEPRFGLRTRARILTSVLHPCKLGSWLRARGPVSGVGGWWFVGLRPSVVAAMEPSAAQCADITDVVLLHIVGLAAGGLRNSLGGTRQPRGHPRPRGLSRSEWEEMVTGLTVAPAAVGDAVAGPAAPATPLQRSRAQISSGLRSQGPRLTQRDRACRPGGSCRRGPCRRPTARLACPLAGPGTAHRQCTQFLPAMRGVELQTGAPAC